MKGEGFLGKRLVPVEEYFYAFFRVLVGFLFFMHGTAKVFGWFSGKAAMTGFMMYVGIFEASVGLLIVLGLWTRLAALVGTIIMLSAWFKAHVPGGWNPFANGGELALMFLAAFVFLIVHGSGRYGLEHCIHKKECI
jgi:putative oxidoreductase